MVVALCLLGGDGRVISYLLKYIDIQKFEPVLVVFQDNLKYDVPDHIRIICLHKKSFLDLPRLIWKLTRLYEKEKPDTVVSFLNYANLIAVLAKKLSSVKPRLVLSVRNQDSISIKYEFLGRLKIWAIPHLYPEADAILCCSKGVGDDLMNQFKIPSQMIKVIYNPVDIEYIYRLATEEVKHPYLNPKGMPVIIAIGRLNVQKNFPGLLRAFTEVTAMLPCRLVIIGEGEERKSLVKMVSNLRIERHVDFIGLQRNPFKYLARSDVFVLSSLWEGFGNVIAEAMACGIPVVSTRCPSGPDEIITDGVTGLLVPAGDETALAKAILHLLKHKDYAVSIGLEGRKSVERFAVNQIIKEYEALFADSSQPIASFNKTQVATGGFEQPSSSFPALRRRE